MSQRHLPFALATCVLAFCASASAQVAQSGEFSVQRFAPAPGPRNFLTVEGARTDGKWAYSLGLFANWSADPFVVKSCVSSSDCGAANAAQRENVRVIENLVTADVLASLTPFPRLQIGLRAPVTFLGGQGIVTEGATAGRPDPNGLKAAGLGDPMLEAKVRVFGGPTSVVALGVAAFATAPVGHAIAQDKYLGDSSPSGGVRGIFDGQAGPVAFGANLAGVFRQSARLGTTDLGSDFRYGLAGAYRVSPSLRLVVEGFGTTQFSSKNGTNSLETDAAVQVTPLASRFSFTVGGGAGLVEGIGVPKGRAFLGVLFNHEPVDSDGDGLLDDVDQCPSAPEDFDGFQDDDGCPDVDNDGDDILDPVDACPTQPGEKDPDPKKNGCPVIIPDRDADGIADDEDKCPDDGGPTVVRRKGEFYGCPDTDRDGVPNVIDKCPEEPEDTDGYQDEDGCPDPDNDGDGIADVDDQCIDQPEIVNGFEDEDGCPDVAPDRDHDGIPDSKDRCPTSPENYNGFQDEDGCPDNGPALAEITGTRIKINGTVNFATDSDKIIGRDSFTILNGVAGLLVNHPEILKIEIDGHTDSGGDRAHNVDLSKRRAQAVATYLQSKGVEERRVATQGFGPDKPIATNLNNFGRAKNRRVEFQILETAKAPVIEGDAPAPAAAPASAPEEAPKPKAKRAPAAPAAPTAKVPPPPPKAAPATGGTRDLGDF